jgi:2-polyprenyl-3-methyl-5-hydroxy-6-metoxy-1,4-benzoquinol methylase
MSLSHNSKLRYLDYGCGSTPLTLQIASKLGFLAEGVEFSDDVVESANTQTTGNVMSVREFSKVNDMYDYIFLGDVIEHLVDPQAELRFFQTRLAEEGLLIAQGPLQGAFTFSHLVVKIKSQFNRKKVSNFPPYHVSLATKKGMLQVMETTDFEIIQMKIFEKNWPAPNLYGLLQDFSIKGFFLLLLKQIDKALSRTFDQYGSQYFLVARKKSATSR